MGVERKQESVREKKKQRTRIQEGRNGGVKRVMEGHTDCWLHGLWSKGRAVRRCNPEDLSAAKSYLCGILCDCAAAGVGCVLYCSMLQTRPACTGFSRIFLMNFLFRSSTFFFVVVVAVKVVIPWGPVSFFFSNKMCNNWLSVMFIILLFFFSLCLCRLHV